MDNCTYIAVYASILKFCFVTANYGTYKFCGVFCGGWTWI